ncbi:Rpn family recombination-promoting nuclease/putative transposase (plasmid) [Arsenophonus sp. aPb]|uniref:Rpn family recombination-promoting nuclease/putative transposase n=1 Tax=Arsenophonus sp. aPb TaxID=3041619 RepID=UPI0024693802|nr:Rpn family recombination-promoting nuclease/putative transposase [Arsenophonus sp. aPb]WGL99941.1 Rpn family recombination-promoting nuclease/putative transposase [Arsenophonus sp. aPb]
MAMKKTLSHHDSLFKKFLGDIAIAKDFLEIHLPENIRRLCDFSTLAMESGSFIEPDLRSQCSDMLYSVQTTAGKGYIYTLIEHQSRPEKLMAFRLLRYSVAAMHQHLEQGNKTLPVVIPLLFYQGKTSPYPYSTQWLDCFADPELAKSVYMQAFPLVDITVIPDEEILSHRRVALMELVQKHIRTRDMLEFSQEIASLLNQYVIQPELFKGLMYYIVERGNTSDAKQFLHQIAEKVDDYREVVMTIAEQLRREGEQKGKIEGIQEGIQKGIQEGIQKGIQEGEKQAAMKIARQLLENGVDKNVIKMSTGLSDAEMKKLFKN